MSLSSLLPDKGAAPTTKPSVVAPTTPSAPAVIVFVTPTRNAHQYGSFFVYGKIENAISQPVGSNRKPNVVPNDFERNHRPMTKSVAIASIRTTNRR